MNKRKREAAAAGSGGTEKGVGNKKDKPSIGYMSIEDYALPVHKLRKPEQGTKPLVLFACGCFSPITNMHLTMFEACRDWLSFNRPEYDVIGGYISPVSDRYNKPGLTPAVHRLSMCELATESSDWVAIDNWEAINDWEGKVYPSARTVMEHLDESLNSADVKEHLDVPESTKIHLRLVCGTDLIDTFARPGLWADEDLEKILSEYGIVSLERHGSHASDTISSLDILFKHQDKIDMVPPLILDTMSSTKLRFLLAQGNSIKYCTPDPVIEYIAKHGLYK